MRQERYPSLEQAKAFIRSNLISCARELLRWKGAGEPHGAKMREAARLVSESLTDAADPMTVAEHLVESMSLEAAIELGAWRAHFPRHTFRRDDGCVTLRRDEAQTR